MNDRKVIIILIIASVLILGGGIFFLLSSSSSSKTTLTKEMGAKMEIPESSFDFKDIPYSGGLAIHSFPIKNSGDKDLKIANLATSCMCTKVYFKKGEEKSPDFGMKGMSKDSAWTSVLKPKEKGEIVASFDPAYHGPSGVGAISRLVSLETNDPDHPYVELSFSGTVVK